MEGRRVRLKRCLDGRRRLTYVSNLVESATHDHYFFDPEECFGVLRSSKCEISQRSDSDNRDGILFVFTKEPQDLFMSWCL